MKIGDPIRLELGTGETGYGIVTALDPLTVRVDAIPFDGPWNAHDTALVEPMPSIGRQYDDFYKPTKLVERKYTMRTVVLYDMTKQFDAVLKEITEAGGVCEGWTSPQPSKKYRGMIGVAHTPSINVREIAKQHGCGIDSTKVFGIPLK